LPFQPKKKIPPIAAAGLALAGCGDDPSRLEQASARIDSLDPPVTAFCMKYVDCYAGSFLFDDVDSCRAIMLSYTDVYALLSDDPAACTASALSYFACVQDAVCGSFAVACFDELEAFEVFCFTYEDYQ